MICIDPSHPSKFIHYFFSYKSSFWLISFHCKTYKVIHGCLEHPLCGIMYITMNMIHKVVFGPSHFTKWPISWLILRWSKSPYDSTYPLSRWNNSLVKQWCPPLKHIAFDITTNKIEREKSSFPNETTIIPHVHNQLHIHKLNFH